MTCNSRFFLPSSKCRLPPTEEEEEEEEESQVTPILFPGHFGVRRSIHPFSTLSSSLPLSLCSPSCHLHTELDRCINGGVKTHSTKKQKTKIPSLRKRRKESERGAYFCIAKHDKFTIICLQCLSYFCQMNHE